MSPRLGRIVDLSHPLNDGTPVYPGDPTVSLSPATTIDRDGVNVLRVEMGSQTGTHVDAPRHFLAGGAGIDQVDLATFIGPASVIDLRGLAARTPITAAMIEAALIEPAGELHPIVLLHTGWSRHWGGPAYHDHPALTADAAQALLDRGVRLVGIDAMSVDETIAEGEHPTGYAAHLALLGHGVVIAENLTDLDRIDFADPWVSLLPIKLDGADGAPVRAVAMEVLT